MKIERTFTEKVSMEEQDRGALCYELAAILTAIGDRMDTGEDKPETVAWFGIEMKREKSKTPQCDCDYNDRWGSHTIGCPAGAPNNDDVQRILHITVRTEKEA